MVYCKELAVGKETQYNALPSSTEILAYLYCGVQLTMKVLN